MKTNIIGIMIALVLAFAAAVGAWAQDGKVSEVRKVDDFSSIKITSVANVIFTQGDRYSLRLEGKEKWVKLTTTEVKGGCLIIAFKKGEKRSVKNIDGLKLYVTAPTLEEILDALEDLGAVFCECWIRVGSQLLRYPVGAEEALRMWFKVKGIEVK